VLAEVWIAVRPSPGRVGPLLREIGFGVNGRRQAGFTSVSHGISVISWESDRGEWLSEVTRL
jgi:hypothetical protein